VAANPHCGLSTNRVIFFVTAESAISPVQAREQGENALNNPDVTKKRGKLFYIFSGLGVLAVIGAIVGKPKPSEQVTAANSAAAAPAAEAPKPEPAKKAAPNAAAPSAATAPAPAAAPKADAPSPGVSMANFRRLRDRMTRAEVAAILGSEGELQMSTGGGGEECENYTWGSAFDGMIVVTFCGGRAISRTQVGL
jgi:hypothetical protein